jgi:hypothetical protein
LSSSLSPKASSAYHFYQVKKEKLNGKISGKKARKELRVVANNILSLFEEIEAL